MKKEQLEEMLHRAISDCCMRGAVTSNWLSSPQQVEEHLLEILSPHVEELSVGDGGKAATLKKLESCAAQFKSLMNYAETQKPVSLSDIEKDVIRYKAKLETLDWFLEISDGGPDDLINEAIKETKAQLEMVEKVTCISQSA